MTRIPCSIFGTDKFRESRCGEGGSSGSGAEIQRTVEDISITFHKQDDFGYIGRDSDIHSLDVEKAISDMRKDQILQQYQYFVGSKTVFTE